MIQPDQLEGRIAVGIEQGSGQAVDAAVSSGGGGDGDLAFDEADLDTARGREMLERDRRGFCPYLWTTWSPGWEIADTDFDRAATAWDNPDWAEISAHAYLHRWGEAPGDPAYQDLEHRLAEPPPVRVPSLVLHGERDGDNLAETTEGKDDLFAEHYQRILLPDVGHFPPREAPQPQRRRFCA
ncbi:alpha/beta fold hydrolase [Streptomyces sp. CA-142005]|uniref:alpha/beta fold hydrolase n=1 Tax=Streptomyces sp. CA-142005 TaxID=3240052 RepID=UPI003D94B53B